MKQIAEQFQGRFARSISLPQVCENLIKAAHDPRIAGVYLQIQPLQCGWGKIDEIRRHLEYFKKSGASCCRVRRGRCAYQLQTPGSHSKTVTPCRSHHTNCASELSSVFMGFARLQENFLSATWL